ncbi:hypothetical protein AcW1_007330 [Taiwanofungus camphoratus]|nr:hypothetical protein AcW2_007599 [Antrodia cinnamomea]KAI0920029.1 hypothetical protein AcV7_006039 [Antrodia cinnamomea]KAI0927421.1 hypothetical protein AcV5_007964 [Antrodia cinnamomea]KAI0952998.1 hypothetical protein AcW1_007330 [Antrodia cinnamomea]
MIMLAYLSFLPFGLPALGAVISLGNPSGEDQSYTVQVELIDNDQAITSRLRSAVVSLQIIQHFVYSSAKGWKQPGVASSYQLRFTDGDFLDQPRGVQDF